MPKQETLGAFIRKEHTRLQEARDKAVQKKAEIDQELGALAEHAVSDSYSVARFLYIYVNKDPNEDLDPVPGEFIRFVYSRQGQEAVVRDGYFPVTKALADQDLGTFGLLASR